MAVSLNPADAWSHYRVGFVLVSQERLDEAISAYQEALRLEPTRYPEARYELGRTLNLLGRYEEGIPHVREAIRLRPKTGG
jgi:superkiller protein 3